ncbi:MAG: hypothetical protein OIN66_00435 [Candidatus Methanoperedens sp.]|nr:hypothetical protein [Candidatus Methanoperedens sp.]
MKHVPRYIASVPIPNQQTEQMNISLCFDKNGRMGIYFQDTVELGQDSNYINEYSFPNCGSQAGGKYSMWLSMFTRHIKTMSEDSD